MNPRLLTLAFVCSASAVLASGCDRNPPGLDGILDAGPSCVREKMIYVAQNYKDSVDYLFVVENTPQMAAMLPAVRLRIRAAMQWLDSGFGDPVDIHIGVITTDLGAGAEGAPGCAPFPGMGGRLQALGAAAPAGCKAPVGAPFIHMSSDPLFPARSNLPDGQDLFQTLDCMLAVGAGGCEYPQPLEAAWMALREQRVANADFLRDDAELIIVFIGTHDDCSAPPDTDLYRPERTDTFGPPGAFRCTRAALRCGPDKQPPTDETRGPLDDCEAATDGPLYPVARYQGFLANPVVAGGIKPNPIDVVPVLVGGPPSPVSVVIGDALTPPALPYHCPSGACGPLLQRSCISPAGLAAEPAIRLQAAIAPSHAEEFQPFCDDDWSRWIAQRPFVGGGGYACLPSLLTDSEHPNCQLIELTNHGDGTTTSQTIPACETPDSSRRPCWRSLNVGEKNCGGRNDSLLALVVDRDVPAEPRSLGMLTCAVECDQ